MIVTFQVQIDPMNSERKFNEVELDHAKCHLNTFCSALESSFKDFIRAQMYVDGKVYKQ